MAQELWANNASTTLASGISSSATSIVVATGTGALFPAITGANYFYATLQPAHTLTPLEIVLVTAISGDTLTVVRAQQGTSASAYLTGDIIENRITQFTLQSFPQLIASATVSGLWNYTTRPTVSGNSIVDPATAFTWTAAQTRSTAGAPEIYNVGGSSSVYEYSAAGFFASGSATATGDIKISLPVGVSFGDRISMVIAMYDGTDGYSEWNIVFTGNSSATIPFKNYDSGGTGGGTNSYSTIMGNAPSGSVRMAYDASHPCIILGSLGTVYNKPIIYVKSIVGDTSAWGAGVTITQITSETGITFAGTTTPSNLFYTNIAGTMTPALSNGTIMATGVSSSNGNFSIVTTSGTPFSSIGGGTTQISGTGGAGLSLDFPTSGKLKITGTTMEFSNTGATTFDNAVVFSGATSYAAPQTFTDQSSDPSAPTAGLSKLYTREYATRSYPAVRDSVGWAHAFQPAFSHGTVALITAGPGNTLSTIGNIGIASQAGTLSTNAAGSNTYGASMNILSAATTGSIASVESTITALFLTATDGYSGGFYFASTCFFPDTAYGSGSTGTRIFIGVSDTTQGTVLNSDSPTTTSSIGFGYSTNAGDTTWHFVTTNGSTGTRTNAVTSFVTQNLYRFYFYAPPGTSTIYWQVDNISAGTSQNGSVTATLPTGTTALIRIINGLMTLSNSARNIGFKQLYVETPQ